MTTEKRAPGKKRERPSGWHKQSLARLGVISFWQPAPPAEPTRWERMLRELGVTDAEALRLLMESRAWQSTTAAAIRQWVRRHYRAAYVPEPVLAAVGVAERDVCSVDHEGRAERARTWWAAHGKRHAGLGE